MKPFELHLGDCLEVLKTLPDNSIDAVVTDPPYGIRFMGKAWDGADIEARAAQRRSMESSDPSASELGAHNSIAAEAGKYDLAPAAMKAFQEFSQAWAAEALRVLKPGGHLLSFASARTYHRMAAGIEDAGFEIRDQIMWVFGSGFPKSLNVSKAVDGHVSNGRSDSLAIRVVNETRPGDATIRPTSTNGHRGIVGSADAGQSVKRDTPATSEGQQWQGWGTALKPAHEPICVARKPLVGTVAANVLAFGTCAINIEACRVPTDENLNGGAYAKDGGRTVSGSLNASGMNVPGKTVGADFVQPVGRWPANLIHDGSAEVVALFPQEGRSTKPSGTGGAFKSKGKLYGQENAPRGHEDNGGSAARFFYCAKASRADRNSGTMSGDVPAVSNQATMREREDADWSARNGNSHPTVKPTDLMAYLCRLVTPPGGTVLDPFMGSGSTGKACMREGFHFIGIEREAEYHGIATSRITHEHDEVTKAAEVANAPTPQLDLFA